MHNINLLKRSVSKSKSPLRVKEEVKVENDNRVMVYSKTQAKLERAWEMPVKREQIYVP